MLWQYGRLQRSVPVSRSNVLEHHSAAAEGLHLSTDQREDVPAMGLRAEDAQRVDRRLGSGEPES